MPEFSDFKTDPLAKALRKRVSKLVRRLANPRLGDKQLYQIQEDLIQELTSVEEGISFYRQEIRNARRKSAEMALEVKAARGELTSEDKEAIKSFQLEAEDHAFSLRIMRYGRWLFRYIADGVAWKAYRYNREIIRALGDKEPVPFISKKEGIDKEIRFFRAIRNLGGEWLPLMHDLTNSVRTADFSVFKDGQLARIIELKIRESGTHKKEFDANFGRSDPRQDRQEDRMQRIFAFFEDGDLGKLRSELTGGKSLHSEVPEIHNFEAVSDGIKAAHRSGFGLEEPQRGVLYLAWDLEKSSEGLALDQATKSHLHIFDTLFTFRSISPRYEAHHLSLPITAMALPAKDMLDILFHRIAVMCLLNFKCIEEFCASRGIPLEFETKDGKVSRILVKSKPHHGEVGEGLWDRVLFEGLSLDSFVGLIQTIMDEFRLTN